MKNTCPTLIKKARALKSKISSLALMLLVAGVTPVLASDPEPTLSIDFDVAGMFTWAQTIINAMLPIVYITMGLGLGFLIIRSLRSAFN